MLRTDLRRSKALVAGVRDGLLDFAVLRKDAIPEAARKHSLPILKMSFHLCIPRGLIKRGLSQEQLANPKLWQTLPFAAGRGGGQMDRAVREGMAKAGVDFKPRFECGSMLQVRQLVKQGDCAAVLPGLALSGLDERALFILPFTPLSGYGRQLALHWNPRQMRRRGVESRQLKAIASLLS